MGAELFIAILGTLFAILFSWAFRVLPQEQWQIIAAVPKNKMEQGTWEGTNLTFYGFFQGTANALAIAMCFVLFGAIGVPAKAVFALITIIFALCWVAS